MTSPVEQLIEKLKSFAENESLCLSIKFDEEGNGWSARLTTRHHFQPICTGWSKKDLHEALAQLEEKAERSLAPYRKKIAAARDSEIASGRRQMRQMGVK